MRCMIFFLEYTDELLSLHCGGVFYRFSPMLVLLIVSRLQVVHYDVHSLLLISACVNGRVLTFVLL